MIEKEKIISEILRLNDENGKVPGQKVFEKSTGISKAYWNGNYWPRWSEAVKEAGLTPNVRNPAIPLDELLDKYLSLVEDLNSVPTMSELRMKANSEPDFPTTTTFQKQIGNQFELAVKALAHARENSFSPEVTRILAERVGTEVLEVGPETGLVSGTVYLLESGGHFKVGRSSDIERRIKQISVAMPEKVELLHAIQTDDTSGIEAYWHKRFGAKRLNGEWFSLSPADVRAFRKRKFQ